MAEVKVKKSNFFNMRKIIISLALLLAWPSMLWAADITGGEAKAIAEKFVTSQQGGASRVSGVATNLQLVYQGTNGKVSDYYVFNRGMNAGYVIVAGEDRAEQILGYADSGSFDINNIPENMKWWLSEYAAEIEYLRSHPQLSAGAAAKKSSSFAGNIEPLLGETKWDQGAPYSNNCPTYTSGSKTLRTATGCVATATAQIMYYHKWPLKGTGSNSYRTTIDGSSVTLSANFSNSTYDWDNMLPTYSGVQYNSTQADAVAKLLSDVGISVNMGYGASSGTQSDRVVSALATNFGYDKSLRILWRVGYKSSDWESMIYKELSEGRPVYYSGHTGKNEGHAFVFDGCNTQGYVHVNWGWSGMSNGYFRTTALAPAAIGTGGAEGGFNYGQAMIVGIKKDAGGAVTYTAASSKLTISTSTATLGRWINYSLADLHMSASTKSTYKMQFGLQLRDESGKVIDTQMRTITAPTPGSYYPSYGFNYQVGATLAEGNYTLHPMFAPAGSTNYQPLPIGPQSKDYVELTVKNGTAYVNMPSVNSQLIAKSIVAAKPAFSQNLIKVNAEIGNNGDEYLGSTYIGVLDANSKAVLAKSESALADIENGSTSAIEYRLTLDVSAGDYLLGVLNGNSELIDGVTVPITVTDKPLLSVPNNTAYRFRPKSGNMIKSDIEGSVTLSNSGGDFNGVVTMLIIGKATDDVLAKINSDSVTIGRGQRVKVRFKGEFANGVVGEQYRACLANPNVLEGVSLWGSKVQFNLVQEVTALTLNKTVLTLEQGKSEKLTATVAPANAYYQTVTWSSSDEQVATVDADGNVTALKEGSAIITATATDGSGVSASCKLAAKPAGVEGVGADAAGVAYGTTGKIVVTGATGKIVVYDLTGRVVATATGSDAEIAVPVGVYVVKAGSHNSKVVVK